MLNHTVRTEMRHRGFAMMLVIVALVVVTVSTTAFLASRANAPEIGENVARGAAARTVAESGIELATAIMQSDEVDWRAAHINGVLIDSYDYGGGTLTVRIADLEGNVPTAETEYVRMTATGDIEGLEQIAEANVEATGTEAAADYDLSEFAVFATEQIAVDGSVIGRWADAPESATGRPVLIGTNSTSAGAIEVSNDAALIDTRCYTRTDASSSIVNDLMGQLLPRLEPSPTGETSIPVPATPFPTVQGLTWADTQRPNLNSGDWFLDVPKVFTSIHLAGFTTLSFDQPNTTLVILEDLVVEDGAELVVNHPNTDVVVLGSVYVQNDAGITIDDGASLRLFVGEQLVLDDGMLGLPRSLAYDDARDPCHGLGMYRDPTTCRVFELEVEEYLQRATAAGWSSWLITPATGRMNWKLDHGGFACAMFYGTDIDFRVTSGSAIFGSVVASRFEMDGNSAVHYDPALNEGHGYTNPESFIYNDDGSMNADVLSMAVDLEDSTEEAIDNYVKTTVAPTTAREWREVRRRLRRVGMKPRWDGDDD